MSDRVDWVGRMQSIIRDKAHPIGIVGLGYVGLPLAMAFANKGYHIVGVDTNKQRVEDINAGKSPIIDVKSQSLLRMVNKGFIRATGDHGELRKAFIVIICVPTPLNKNKQPDLSYVEDSVALVARHMYDGTMVVLESTSYPGTTRDVVYPIMLRTASDKTFFLAYSPERVDPSSRAYTLRNTPKLVSGMDAETTGLVAELYSSIVKNVVKVSKPEIAETAKVFENVFRSVNIGLVNELAMMCEKLGVSVWEVIEAASTKPFGFMRFNPSPGVGGHCIPIDPYYLDLKANEVGFHSRFIRDAMDINEGMPEHVLNGIAKSLDRKFGLSLSKSKVLLLGVAYKPNVGDMRESPALQLLKLLKESGADVHYDDPFVPYIDELDMHKVAPEQFDQVIKTVDCVVMAVGHSQYSYVWRHLVNKAKLFYDACGWTYTLRELKLDDPKTLDNVIRMGE